LSDIGGFKLLLLLLLLVVVVVVVTSVPHGLLKCDRSTAK
jgi:hypothetical protein